MKIFDLIYVHVLEDGILSCKDIASKLVLQIYLQWIIPVLQQVSSYWELCAM